MKPVRSINGIDLTAHGGLIAREIKRYRRFIGGCIEWEDLFQVGWLGLHHAAERFDPERGFKFSTYAHWWIRTFIQRSVMNDRRTVRIPVHVQTKAYSLGERLQLDALSLDAPVNWDEPGDTWVDRMPSDSDQASDAELRELEALVDAAVETLGEKERRIIRGRFWSEYTLAEIGDDEGVSRERIRQREAKALERLELRLGRELL